MWFCRILRDSFKHDTIFGNFYIKLNVYRDFHYNFLLDFSFFTHKILGEIGTDVFT